MKLNKINFVPFVFIVNFALSQNKAKATEIEEETPSCHLIEKYQKESEDEE
jgi:hypothetical protein